MKSTNTLPSQLHAFFYEWLIQQRNVSMHTVRSYRDAWKLFLRFAADRHHCSVTQLTLAQLGSTEVLAFLRHSEEDRKVGIGTRNCRLSALRSFFAFVGGREPMAVAQCAEILRIPTKRAPRRTPGYLEPAEINAILSQPDQQTREGYRDYVLLHFLYNTGARIQEALGVRPGDLRLASPPCARLFGKGRKERICPLWPETVIQLKALLKRQPRADDAPIFINRYGQPLSASGVRFKLAQYVAAAAKSNPAMCKRRISPHTFRHAAAVSMVSAGIDVTVIRSFLGHANLDTTNYYAHANLETKRKALERIDPPSRRRPPRWKREAGLLSWLESL
jgi:site-specific recombinase XerD